MASRSVGITGHPVHRLSDKVIRMFAILVRFDLKDEAAARGFDAVAEETIAAVQALESETPIYVVHRVESLLLRPLLKPIELLSAT
jgi:hypothetical protein